MPKTFLPSEKRLFMEYRKNHKKKSYWICKPNGGACGRGIYLVDSKKKLKKRTGYIYSEYVDKPHLIDGFKYDLRVYVLVSSFDPLRIYVYPDGLVRICTE